MAPSVVGSLNEKDEKSKKAKQPIVIWPEWTEQDIAQEKWVSQMYLKINIIHVACFVPKSCNTCMIITAQKG